MSDLVLMRSFGQVVRLAEPDRHHRRFGLPIGGPFDPDSAQAAQDALGTESAPQWEVLGSAEFRVLTAGTMLATGPQPQLHLNGRAVAPFTPFAVQTDDVLEVRATRIGVRTYLTLVPGMIPPSMTLVLPSPGSLLRFVPGPDTLDLPLEGWAVTPNSNRIGIRLQGPGVPHSIELPSRPTTFGTIQVPPNGQPILFGPDGPTIGGYPQAGVVISADLSRLGQLGPGMPVSFRPVDLETARHLRREADRARDQRRAMWTLARRLRGEQSRQANP